MRRALLYSFAALLASSSVAGLRAVADDAPGASTSDSVSALIERLGSDDFRVREQASRELAAMGASARPALEKAMKESESLEVRWRAEQLLRRIDRQGERRLE